MEGLVVDVLRYWLIPVLVGTRDRIEESTRRNSATERKRSGKPYIYFLALQEGQMSENTFPDDFKDCTVRDWHGT